MKLNNTSQRRVLLEELRKVDTHPTADELYMMVRKRLPKISLGTVYRNLEMLSTAGEVAKIEMTGKQKRFDGRAGWHHHLRCLDCDAVEDLHLPKLSELDGILGTLIDGELIRGCAIEFTGLCKKCAIEKIQEDNGKQELEGEKNG
ncbi:MAG: hypothetical protein A2X49_14410 [Lentisphaerae bacterium GWF2_52_8]|nr:MAG: hypothetical protein A2X49_14410 [Lentisphaerae bacterium GWF2_52_8]